MTEIVIRGKVTPSRSGKPSTEGYVVTAHLLRRLTIDGEGTADGETFVVGASGTTRVERDDLGAGCVTLTTPNRTAAGAMMIGWRNRMSMTVEAAMDSLGGTWRAKYDANEALTPTELRGLVTTAVHGDGTADGTTVTLADSATGTFVSEPFTEFARRLSARDPVRVGVGIFHY